MIAKRSTMSAAKKKRVLRENLWGYGFISLNILLILVFMLFPLLFSFVISFEKWTPLAGGTWVGFKNYLNVLRDDLFLTAMLNNLKYAFWTILIGFVTAFGSSMLVRNIPNRTMRKTIRFVVFIPTVCSTVMVSMLWNYMTQPQIGPINTFLRAIGFSSPPSWLSDATTAPIVLYTVVIWCGTGYWMVIFLTRMMEIPETLFEAARIDGADFFDTMFRITLPLSTPTIYLYLSMSLITCWAQFDIAYMLSNVTGTSSTTGGPSNSLLLPTFVIYRNAFGSMNFGFASAMGWILLIVIILIAFINSRLSKYWVSYDT